MHFCLVGMVGEFMCCCCIAKYPHDLFFRQDISIIQRQKQRLANGESGGSGNVIEDGHERFRFLLQGGSKSERLVIIGPIC